MRTTIKNDFLTVEIDTLGAELKSIVDKDGVERLWQGDEKYWKGKAPVLFPISGGMKDRAYTYKDRPYSIPFHGLARQSEFEVVEVIGNVAKTIPFDSVIYLKKGVYK